MNFTQTYKSTKVFIAGDLGKHKNKIIDVLHSAGMQILISEKNSNTNNLMEQADCTLQVLNETYSSLSEQHFDQATALLTKKNDFKIFIWQAPEVLVNEIEIKQQGFIKKVRNNIYSNMIFSNQESVVMLVEDIRSIMDEEANVNLEIKKTDIFFIYNEIDEDAAHLITSSISDVADVKKLNIVLSNNVDYAKQVAMQMQKAKLTVIFFKRSLDWAMPFTQQIWKNIGGASAKSNMLFIGDSTHEQNTAAKFDVPNVTSMAVAEELIPLEVIVQFDKLKETIN